MDEQYTNALVNALADFIRAYMRDQLEQSSLLDLAVERMLDDKLERMVEEDVRRALDNQLVEAVREVLEDVEFDVEVTARL